MEDDWQEKGRVRLKVSVGQAIAACTHLGVVCLHVRTWLHSWPQLYDSESSWLSQDPQAESAAGLSALADTGVGS